MMSRALNFLWINLDFAKKEVYGDEQLEEPLPPQYIESIRKATEKNTDTEVRLWVDSRRLTKQQRQLLEKNLSKYADGNLTLMDLRDIPEYDQTPIFNQAESSSYWNRDKTSLIWRQVDAAKVLICLQGDFDQVFFSDIDYAGGLKTDSEEIQNKLTQHGLFFRGYVENGKAYFENQLWGFNKERRPFFEILYAKTLDACITCLENGYGTFIDLIREELEKGEKLDTREICYVGWHDGSAAYHPGHKWSHGSGDFPISSESLYGFDFGIR